MLTDINQRDVPGASRSESSGRLQEIMAAWPETGRHELLESYHHLGPKFTQSLTLGAPGSDRTLRQPTDRAPKGICGAQAFSARVSVTPEGGRLWAGGHCTFVFHYEVR